MIREYLDKINNIFKYKLKIQSRQWEDHGLLVDPNNAIWFFGCSHVFGTGLEHNETAPYHLGRLLNQKVINYGKPGIGPLTIKNQIETLLKKHRPKAVIIAWPGFDRWQSGSILWIPNCLTDLKSHSDNFGCKKIWPTEWEQYKNLVLSGEVRKINLEAVTHTRNLIKEFPCIEFSYTENEYGFITPVAPFEDFAQDNNHPGVITQKKIAQWIKNEIQLLL